MATVTDKVTIAADPETVFAAYTARMGEWWPFQGTYRYTFAPEGTSPDGIFMEAAEGGRFYERWADGTEHQIGIVKVWKPPSEVVYTWEVDGWSAPSTVTVRFVAEGTSTTVIVEHSGLPDDQTAAGYSTGQKEILAVFAEYVGG